MIRSNPSNFFERSSRDVTIWDSNFVGLRDGASTKMNRWGKKLWRKVGVEALDTNCDDPNLWRTEIGGKG